MTDLEIAKQGLSGHTICLCKDGKCLFDNKKGIAPMMGFIAENTDLSGYSVADLVVGKAAAMLFVKCKIKSVFAAVLSSGGAAVLEKFGIPYECEKTTPSIINRDGSDICPMEKTVLEISDPEEAYAALKQKILSMQKQ